MLVGIGLGPVGATKVWATVKISDAHSPPRSRSAIAIVAAVCMFAAIFGGWLLRVERATPGPSHASPLAVANTDHPQLHHHPSPTSQTAFKSAGIQRNRPPTSFGLIPSLQQWPLPVPESASSADLGGARPHARAAACSGQDLLTQLCVALR